MIRGHILMLGLFVLMTSACSSPIPNRNPVGETFPTVTGTTLTEKSVQLPALWKKGPVLVLVGYVQESQFDLDRWAVGLVQIKFPVPIVEVPTIKGMVPSLIRETIDNGMRSGIPREDWANVITVFGDEAEHIVKLTGNEGPRRGRIFLLDTNGKIIWFWDQGFSPKRLLEIDGIAKRLTKSTPAQ